MEVTIGVQYRIWLAAAQDDTRPVLTGIWIDTERKQAIAADGFLIGVVPCEIEGPIPDGQIVIPKDIVKKASGFSIRVESGQASTNEKGRGMRVYADLLSGTYPNVYNLIPKAVRNHPTKHFAFNYKYIQRLAEAIDSPWQAAILFEPQDLDSPYVLVGESGGVGVIMPMVLDKPISQINKALANIHAVPEPTPEPVV